MDKCPTCEREFERLGDYPLVEIIRLHQVEQPEFFYVGHGKTLAEEKDAYEEIIVPKSPNLLERLFGLEGRLKKGKRLKGLVDGVVSEEVLDLFKETGKTLVAYKGKVYRKMKASAMIDGELAGVYPEEMDVYGENRDVTEEVKQLRDNPDFQKYLSSLENLVGKESSPEEVLPPRQKPDHYFKIPDTEFYLDLVEAKAGVDGQRMAEVKLWKEGGISFSQIAEPIEEVTVLMKVEYVGKTREK